MSTDGAAGSTLTIASNQGNVGGGEVMLLSIAEAARHLGRAVTVVAPKDPGSLLSLARDKGFSTVAIPGDGAVTYLRNLRRWDATERTGLLWCNGLRPGFATSGHPDRIVHLHQLPGAPMRPLAKVAMTGAKRVVVPSQYLADAYSRATVLWNWTDDLARPQDPGVPSPPRAGTVTVGYLGRLTQGKGVPVLCQAVSRLRAQGRDVKLLLAGESRFVKVDDARTVERAVAALGPAAEQRGWMDREEFFASVDLAVFPSSRPESFGLVAAEAMAARCPFVVSDVGALSEVVGSDYPYLVRPDDSAALAECIAQALDANWDDQLEQSYQRWSMNFTQTAGRARLQQMLDEIDPAKERA